MCGIGGFVAELRVTFLSQQQKESNQPNVSETTSEQSDDGPLG